MLVTQKTHPPVCQKGDVLIIQLERLVIMGDGLIKILGFVGSIALLLLLQCLLLALHLGFLLTLLLSFRFWSDRLGRLCWLKVLPCKPRLSDA